MVEVQAMWEAPWKPGEFVERQREIMDSIKLLDPKVAKREEDRKKQEYEHNWASLKLLSDHVNKRRN